MAAIGDCSICCSFPSKIQCQYCAYAMCKKCLSEYILTLATKPSCPNCRKEMSDEFLYKNFTKKFVDKDVRHRKEELLFSGEVSKFPETQIVIERKKQALKVRDEINEMRRKMEEMKEHIVLLCRRENNLRNGIEDDADIKVQEERRKFVFPCPAENCRGFLSTKWKCGICDRNFCKDCHEQLDEEHKCNPQTLETIALIEKDSKRCPKCGVIIYRLYGCDQMFCTNCKTPFDWKTLKIVNGVIHNPHYFEWRNRVDGPIRRQGGDIPCGGLINRNLIRTKEMIDARAAVGLINQTVTHHDNYVNGEFNNLNNRLDFLNGKINEEEFKRRTFIGFRTHDRMSRYYKILQTFVEIASEIIAISVQNEDEKKGYQELCAFRDVVNADIIKLNEENKYSTILMISDSFGLGEIDNRKCEVCGKKEPNYLRILVGKWYCDTHYHDKRRILDQLKQRGLKCLYVMKSGKRKGVQCGEIAINEEGTRCTKHLRND